MLNKRCKYKYIKKIASLKEVENKKKNWKNLFYIGNSSLQIPINLKINLESLYHLKFHSLPLKLIIIQEI